MTTTITITITKGLRLSHLLTETLSMSMISQTVFFIYQTWKLGVPMSTQGFWVHLSGSIHKASSRGSETQWALTK